MKKIFFWFYCFYDVQNMINLDGYTNEDEAEHNLKWLYIPDHPYKYL